MGFEVQHELGDNMPPRLEQPHHGGTQPSLCSLFHIFHFSVGEKKKAALKPGKLAERERQSPWVGGRAPGRPTTSSSSGQGDRLCYRFRKKPKPEQI